MNLKTIRLQRGLRMKTVAQQAGISESMYCLVEKGMRTPSVETAKRIAGVLGFDWTEFFKEDTPA